MLISRGALDNTRCLAQDVEFELVTMASTASQPVSSSRWGFTSSDPSLGLFASTRTKEDFVARLKAIWLNEWQVTHEDLRIMTDVKVCWGFGHWRTFALALTWRVAKTGDGMLHAFHQLVRRDTRGPHRKVDRVSDAAPHDEQPDFRRGALPCVFPATARVRPLYSDSFAHWAAQDGKIRSWKVYNRGSAEEVAKIRELYILTPMKI